MLGEERGAKLIGRQERVGDQHLTVALAGARRFFAALVDGDGVHPVVGEEHVRKRVEAREAAGPAHVAGPEEGADRSGVVPFQRKGAAGARPEHGGDQLGGARLAQITLGKRGKKLVSVQTASLYSDRPGLPERLVKGDPRAGRQIEATRARFGNHRYTHPPFGITAQHLFG